MIEFQVVDLEYEESHEKLSHANSINHKIIRKITNLDCVIPIGISLIACMTCTTLTSLQLIVHCLGTSTSTGQLKFSKCNNYFGLIDHLTC